MEQNRIDSLNRYEQFKNTVVELADVELTRLNYDINKYNSIVNFLIDSYFASNVYSFFNLDNMKDLTETIFKTISYRDYILNLSDKVSLTTPMSLEEHDQLCELVANSICRNKPDVNYLDKLFCFMPHDIIQSIYVNKDTIHNVLKDNFWLLVFYLLIVNFQATQTYHTFSTINNTTSK